MKILAALTSAFVLFYTLFIAPFEIPASVLRPEGRHRLSIQSDLIRAGKIMLMFYALSLIQGWALNTFAGERAEALNELTQTILSGQDFNVLLVLWKILTTCTVGALSLKTFAVTICINIVYIIILAAIIQHEEAVTYFVRDRYCIIPFNKIYCALTALVLMLIFYLFTQKYESGFLHIVIRNLWTVADKVKITSAVGTVVGLSLSCNSVKVVLAVTKTRSIHGIIDRLNVFR